ncbi:MAG: hypothetical protein ACU833_02055 [Gammaproteobacteria bacterium]
MKALLNSVPPWHRRRIAQILHNVGEKEGTLHLTYESMRVHPLHKREYTTYSDWSNIALRYASSLTDECTNLLIDEMLSDKPFFHGLTLASVPAEKVAPRMLQEVERNDVVGFYAAFVLAMHGRDEGRKILEDALICYKNPFLAAIALAKIPDSNTLDQIKAYTLKDHPIYSVWDKCFHDSIYWLAKKLVCLLENEQNAAYRLIDEYYATAIGRIGVYKIKGHSLNFLNIRPTPDNQEQLATKMLINGGRHVHRGLFDIMGRKFSRSGRVTYR